MPLTMLIVQKPAPSRFVGVENSSSYFHDSLNHATQRTVVVCLTASYLEKTHSLHFLWVFSLQLIKQSYEVILLQNLS